jgi:hypothetical protein
MNLLVLNTLTYYAFVTLGLGTFDVEQSSRFDVMLIVLYDG